MTEGTATLWLVAVAGLGVAAVALVALAFVASRRPSASGEVRAELGRLSSQLFSALAELRGQVGHLGERVEATSAALAEKTFESRSAIQREIGEAHRLVQEVRTELAERKRRDDEVERAVRHLETVLAGAPTKGAAGENILDEAFSSFPPEMIERNFRVRGKVVEYVLVLAGGNRRMPIDSKWPATSALETLAMESDAVLRQKAAAEVRAVLRHRVREVAQYIDPLTTTDKAIAAVPDAAYPLCGELAFEAYRMGVIVMPYSMIVPYVLNLYNLHLKYARSVDLESLDHSLSDIERNVDALDKILEDRVQRGATMVRNAYDEMRDIADKIRRTLGSVRALPAVVTRQALAEAPPAAGAIAEAAPGSEEGVTARLL